MNLERLRNILLGVHGGGCRFLCRRISFVLRESRVESDGCCCGCLEMYPGLHHDVQAALEVKEVQGCIHVTRLWRVSRYSSYSLWPQDSSNRIRTGITSTENGNVWFSVGGPQLFSKVYSGNDVSKSIVSGL
jgi:hypothetical protein